MTLTEFLLQRIAEDEADAADMARLGRVTSGPPYWPAARFLAECEAKRQIVELHSSNGYGACISCGDSEDWPCLTGRALALPYADHPNYQEAWKP